MANHKSAKKRARQTVVRSERNTAYMSKVRTALKKFNVSLEKAAEAGSKDMGETEALFRSSQSLLQKAAQKGMLHKNNASRKVQRLYKKMTKVTAVATASK